MACPRVQKGRCMEHREPSPRAQQPALPAVMVYRVGADGRLRRLRDESRAHGDEGGQEVFARSDRIIRGCGGEGETNDLGLPE